jgi:hypothetical protein
VQETGLASSEDRGSHPGPRQAGDKRKHRVEESETLTMCPNQDAILERLETTKQFGLLSDYLVSWTGRSGRFRAKVTVWGKDGTPDHVVERYIAQLLKGLVPARQISIAAD